MMVNLRHPNIVAFYGTVFKPGNYAIVLELCASGSLHDALHSGRELTARWKTDILRGAAAGLAFLHAKEPRAVVHGDLKARNILLAGDGAAKLCDFGLATAKSDSATTTAVGAAAGGLTLSWSAPELLLAKKASKTKHSDIYAFGMTVWEVLTRELPFAGLPETQVNPVPPLESPDAQLSAF
jgi:sterile alpha motif and leucine zipper-containing kinase AZK